MAESIFSFGETNKKIEELSAHLGSHVLFKAYSFLVDSQATSVWSAPIRYADLTVTLPDEIESANQIYAMSHNNQFWVVNVEGTNGSKIVSLRILTLSTNALTGAVTIWYQK